MQKAARLTHTAGMWIRLGAALMLVAPTAVACSGGDEAAVDREAALRTSITHCLQNNTDAPFTAVVSNSPSSSLTIAPGTRSCAESFSAPRDVNIDFMMSREETPETTWPLRSRLTLSTRNQFEVYACGYSRWETWNEDVLDCGGEKLKVTSTVDWYNRSLNTVIAPSK